MKWGVWGARPPEFGEILKINTEFGQIWVLFGQSARMKSKTARKMGGQLPPAPPSRTPMVSDISNIGYSGCLSYRHTQGISCHVVYMQQYIDTVS